MKFLISRCTLCGRTTRQQCQYCDSPVCQRCQVARKGKIYCSTRHRDMDASVGHLFRHLNRSFS